MSGTAADRHAIPGLIAGRAHKTLTDVDLQDYDSMAF
jgi:hypothetical protein